MRSTQNIFRRRLLYDESGPGSWTLSRDNTKYFFDVKAEWKNCLRSCRVASSYAVARTHRALKRISFETRVTKRAEIGRTYSLDIVPRQAFVVRVTALFARIAYRDLVRELFGHTVERLVWLWNTRDFRRDDPSPSTRRLGALGTTCCTIISNKRVLSGTNPRIHHAWQSRRRRAAHTAREPDVRVN